jgi:hypothetical protein
MAMSVAFAVAGNGTSRPRFADWRKLAPTGLWLGFFAALVASCWPVLDAPPYIEQAAGLWTEASFLVDTSFDYRRLAAETHGDETGPRAYLTSIAPAIVAGLMKASDDPRFSFVAYRLVTLGLGALILVCVYRLVVNDAGAATALLACLVVAAWPLFAVQLEMLGLEIAAVAPLMLGALCAVNGRYGAATALGLLASTVKITGLELNLALLLLALWQLLVVRRDRRRWGVLIAANASIVLVAAAGSQLAGHMRPVAGMSASDRDLGWHSCPYLLVLLSVLLPACVAGASWRLARLALSTGSFGEGLRRLFDPDDRRVTAVLIGWLIIAINLVLVALHPFEVRYLTIVIPLCVVILALGIGRPGLPRFVGWGVLCVALALCLANRYGQLLPQLPEIQARQWGALERSLEYRADQEKQRALVAFVERQAQPVLATGIFVNYLHLPRLGYVRSGFRLPGSFYHFNAVDDNIRALLTSRPEKVLVVLDGHFASLPFPGYGPPAPKAYQLIYSDGGHPAHIVYARHFDPAFALHEGTRQYFGMLFWNVDDQPHVIGCLLTLGWGDLAAQCLPPNIVDLRQPAKVDAALDFLLERYRRRVEIALGEHPGDPELRNMMRLIEERRKEVAARPDRRFATRLRPLTPLERYPREPIIQRLSFLMPGDVSSGARLSRVQASGR